MSSRGTNATFFRVVKLSQWQWLWISCKAVAQIRPHFCNSNPAIGRFFMNISTVQKTIKEIRGREWHIYKMMVAEKKEIAATVLSKKKIYRKTSNRRRAWRPHRTRGSPWPGRPASARPRTRRNLLPSRQRVPDRWRRSCWRRTYR